MKYFLRVFLFHVFSLWIVTSVYGGLIIQGGVTGILTAGLMLAGLMVVVKPIFKILFIPINFITFGIASWFINATLLFLLTLLLPEVIVREYTFPGFNYMGFVIPSISFNYLASLVISSVSITALVHILYGVSEN